MIRSTFLMLLFFALTGGCLHAQQALSFNEVVIIALENNYDIRIARGISKMAVNDNTSGNAGFLPVVVAGADANRSIRDSRLTFFDGRNIEADDARSDQLNAFVSIDWTIFDGLQMFATRDKLREMEVIGKLEIQYQFEQVLLGLSDLFYRTVQEEKLLEVYRNSLEISKMRYRIEERALDLGGSSELQKLNAEVDMNADSAQVMQQKMMIRNLKAELNLVMGLEPDHDFNAVADMQPLDKLNYSALVSGMRGSNVSLLAARSRSRVSKYEIDEARSTFMPRVGIFADFTRNQQENEVGILQRNLTSGPNVGVSLRWNLFNGFNDRRELDNRKIIFENATIEVERVEAEALTGLLTQYNEYDYALQLLQLEKGSLVTAQRNLEVAVETYRLGAINAIEFRTIQQSELEAEARLLAAEYMVKVAEVRLQVLGGVR